MNQLSSSFGPAFPPYVKPLLQSSDIPLSRQTIRSVGYSSGLPDPHLDTMWLNSTLRLPNTDPLTSPQSSALLQSPIPHSQNEHTSLEHMKEWADLRKATPPLSQISPPRLPSQSPAILHPGNTKPNHPLLSYWEAIKRHTYQHLLLRLPSLYSNRVDRVFQEARMSKPGAATTHAVVVAGAIALGVGGGNIPTAQGGEEGKRWVSDVLDGITGTPRRSFGTLRQPSERERLFDGNAGHNWGTPNFRSSPSSKFTPLGLHGPEASQATLADAVPPGEQWTVPHVPWSLERFKEEWESFVIGLIKEWKTLNVLSALLLT